MHTCFFLPTWSCIWIELSCCIQFLLFSHWETISNQIALVLHSLCSHISYLPKNYPQREEEWCWRFGYANKSHKVLLLKQHLLLQDIPIVVLFYYQLLLFNLFLCLALNIQRGESMSNTGYVASFHVATRSLRTCFSQISGTSALGICCQQFAV